MSQAKERPILFSGPMVRAILDGRKTQSRRIVRVQPDCRSWCLAEIDAGVPRTKWAPCYGTDETPNGQSEWIDCPYGKPGDRLRISEEVKVKAFCEDWYSVHFAADSLYLERACDVGLMQKIKNYKTGHLRGVHLPPAYARPTRLEITGVRVERLTDISPEDALAEGVADSKSDYEICKKDGRVPVIAFAKLWQSINGPDSWAANPWVWVIEFRKTEAAQ